MTRWHNLNHLKISLIVSELYVAGERVKESLASAQTKMKRVCDHKVVKCQFISGDQVLTLVPLFGSQFQAKFHGSYSVASGF